MFRPELHVFESGSDTLAGIALSFGATASASLGNMISVRNQRDGMPVIETNTFSMAYGAAITAAWLLSTGGDFAFDPALPYVLSLAYLAVFASAIGFWCYLSLLGRIGADRGAYATVLFPLVALGLSTLFEGYRWTPDALAGVGLVLLGNVLVLTRLGPRRKTASGSAVG